MTDAGAATAGNVDWVGTWHEKIMITPVFFFFLRLNFTQCVLCLLSYHRFWNDHYALKLFFFSKEECSLPSDVSSRPWLFVTVRRLASVTRQAPAPGWCSCAWEKLVRAFDWRKWVMRRDCRVKRKNFVHVQQLIPPGAKLVPSLIFA